ncbi:MAG: hypothetical protein GY698_14495 [Actinomycetia bacterium]|nr:hypothetical protein [Actinomycetes bacterium]
MAGRRPTPSNPVVVNPPLRDIQRELKRLDDPRRWTRELRVVNKNAAEFIAAKARDKAVTPIERLTAKSIKAQGEQRRSKVSIGGARAPWALGGEFGSIQYRQFRPWRGNQWTAMPSDVGYLVHPAIEENRDEFTERYANDVQAFLGDAFPD